MGEGITKAIATILGAILLLAGVGVAIAHYILDTTGGMKFVTLGIAAVLLVLGWALFDWGRGISRRWGGDKPK